MEKLWEYYLPPEGSGADYAVRVEGDELEPYVKRGGVALNTLRLFGELATKIGCGEKWGNI